MAFLQSELMKTDEDHGITAIAIDGDKNSQSAVKWAMDNLVNSKNPANCILVHVQCKTLHPGKQLSNLSKEGRTPTDQELQQFFLPYRGFCARKGIETKEVVIHDIDVPSALIDYIIHNRVANIVVGASHRNAFARKFKNPDTPSTLIKSAPESCAIYVISKGKVQTFRLASRPHMTSGSTHSSISAHSNASAFSIGSANSTGSANYCPPRQSPPTSRSIVKQQNIWEIRHGATDSLPSDDVSQISFCESWKSEGSDKSSSEQSNGKDKLTFSFKTISPLASPGGHSSEGLNEDPISDGSEFSGPQSLQSTDISYDNLDFSVASESSKSLNSSQLANLLDAEMKRLKLELQQSMQLFNSVTKEAVLAKQMVRELHRLQTLKPQKTDDENITEEAALTLAEVEKQNKIVAFEAAQAAHLIAEIESQMKNSEKRAQQEAEEIANNHFHCRRYTIEDIEVATNHFAPSNKIGEGGYGPVFKGMLNHIAVAIKILRPDLSQGQKQFRQEVDVLSSMRHPHMVILLGACPEYGCLVYEYMENGSLEDRLFRKGNTPPIPWRTRFKIAFEIATALLFLHETKPEPLVHRDLKPANILLDCNYVSKISDVGLARLLPPSEASNVTQYRMTAAAGTFYYIDPEYQQTGMLGVKSDLYSFGVVLLQLLTAKPPMGLAYQVQDAIEKGMVSDMLDQSLTDWPVNEALSLAKLAVQCCELRKKDRPDLASVIIPELKRLIDLSMTNEASQPMASIPLPSRVDSISEARSHSNEIIAKRGWQQHLRSMTRLWSVKSNNPRKSSIDSNPPPPPLPRGNLASGISNIMVFPRFCSSFGSCTSVPDLPTHKCTAFSCSFSQPRM